MKKRVLTLLLIVFLFIPFFVFADGVKTNIVFKARVSTILKEKTAKNNKGEDFVQQNIELTGLENERQGKKYYFVGINDFEVIKNRTYKVGDKVLLLESFNANNEPQYYILDYVRSDTILYLFLVFVLILFLVGRMKGVRSLLSLILTFFLIFKFIIPEILLGVNPLLITLVGSALILFIIIYVTEGFKPLSHIAVLSIVISLIISVFFSWFFVLSAQLSGIFNEEIGSIANIGDISINFQGLLLAGIIIGLLGVLDDVVISQASTVEQLYLTNKNQSKKELFSKSYKVGISHISSMTNTLFLAYAGVSLPLLVLIVSGDSSFSNSFDIINNEQIATEIVRTLSGSIGLVMSVPISTYLAVLWYKRK